MSQLSISKGDIVRKVVEPGKGYEAEVIEVTAGGGFLKVLITKRAPPTAQEFDLFKEGVEGGADPESYELVTSATKFHQSPLGTNPKDLLGIKKVQINLVPPSSIIYQAQAMEDGAVKYGPFNWRKNKVKTTIYVAAAMRHLMAFADGEENAPDSGKPHLGHALACLGILVDAKETGNLVDDRPTAGAASALISRLEEAKKKA